MRADLVVQIRVELAAPGERAEEAGEARDDGQGYFAFTAETLCFRDQPVRDLVG